MTHKDYPQNHCPLTGALCAKAKILKITELNQGDSVNFGLCQECSKQWAANYSNSELTPLMKPVLNMGSLPDAIKELADIVFNPPVSKQLPKITVSHELPITPKLLQDAAIRVAKRKGAKIVCPGCGSSLAEMGTQDRLGCGQCYDTFAKYLRPLIEGFHGSLEHKGKVPKNWEEKQIEEVFPADEVIKFKIASLKDEQRDAIEKELYERAGEIVHEIKTLEEKLNEASSVAESPSSPEENDQDQ
tara:strand:- start:2693 stop:3427 length:735 start_codon:yes stop_codon:yes gene_type:complete